jgi:hypothetical protein
VPGLRPLVCVLRHDALRRLNRSTWRADRDLRVTVREWEAVFREVLGGAGGESKEEAA